jgi:hypothetical protein
LKVNKVSMLVSSVLFVFWYHSMNFLDTPRRFPREWTSFILLSRSYEQADGSQSHPTAETRIQFQVRPHEILGEPSGSVTS